MDLSLISSEKLMEELIARSDGCAIVFSECGNLKHSYVHYKYGNAEQEDIIGLITQLVTIIAEDDWSEYESEEE